VIMALAVVNAIPEFQQDGWWGSATWWCARSRRAVPLTFIDRAGFARVLRIVAGKFPKPCLAAMLALPLLIASGAPCRTYVRVAATVRAGHPQHRSAATCWVVSLSPPASCSIKEAHRTFALIV